MSNHKNNVGRNHTNKLEKIFKQLEIFKSNMVPAGSKNKVDIVETLSPSEKGDDNAKI
tara:strand:- start:193 stop:366 length:174 start_codon:yes stop_codon:yes gene_type:complete